MDYYEDYEAGFGNSFSCLHCGEFVCTNGDTGGGNFGWSTFLQLGKRIEDRRVLVDAVTGHHQIPVQSIR